MYPIISEPLFIAAAGIWLIQVFVNLTTFRKLIFQKPDCNPPESHPQGVSVIISAKNEALNLRANLPEILTQDFSPFEVIVVNDQSEDGTKEIVENYQAQYQNLKLVNIEEHVKKRAGKKFALTMGIKKAENEILLLTDADCRPASKHWISLMQRHYKDEKTQFVIGFSPYESKPSPLNTFIQYDTFMTAYSYLGLGMAGMPYMGVGRNLSYRKSLFMANKGFAKYQHVPAGDDDLFVNDLGKKDNVAFELCPESFMISKPKEAIKNWFRQKSRHLSVGKYYKKSHQLVLGLLGLINLAFYLTLAALLIQYPTHYLSWGLLGLKLVSFNAFTLPVLKKFQMLHIGPYAFLLDLIYQTLYLFITGTFTLFKKKIKGWS